MGACLAAPTFAGHTRGRGGRSERGLLRGVLPAVVLVLAVSLACTRPQPCQDPTNEGLCFCPVGQSCHHQCGQGTGHCTLGCSQGNVSCSVNCAGDCTALCSGASRCDSICGERCNVSCELVTERCTAVVGALSHVNCEGAADCTVTCRGSCEVACARGHCRLLCAPGEDCDMDCGGSGAAEKPLVCPDGSQVCGRTC